jgi:hypothetical protein
MIGIVNHDQGADSALVHSFGGNCYRVIGTCRINISHANAANGHESVLPKPIRPKL